MTTSVTALLVPHFSPFTYVPACEPSDFGNLRELIVRSTPSWVRNLASVALAPSYCFASLPARAGWMSTTPLPSVMMPEVKSLLRGRLKTLPQTSIDRAASKWSLAVGGVDVGWVVVVVVVVAFSLATSRSWRLKTISPSPTTQTRSRIEYHPRGVRCR